MKYLIIIISVVVCNTAAFAQVKDTVNAKDFKPNQKLRSGTVFAEKNFRKFSGTWVFQDSKNQFTLKLESKIVTPGSSIYSYEMLVGGYQIKKNGNVVSNTLEKEPIYAKANHNDPTKITLFINNLEGYKNTAFEATLLDQNTLVVSTSEKKGEGLKKDVKLDFLNNIKFTRQK